MKAADWVLSQPWNITEESIGTIVAIADRTNDSPEAVAAKLGRPLDNTRTVTVRDGVAIIPVTGPISRYANMFSEISGATAVEHLATDFRAAMDDPSVKAVVLDMDTPGGTVNGPPEFAGHVFESRGRKPVVAYASGAAQSAGYWIASAADRIVTSPMALIGSIGTVWGVRADSKDGRTVKFISSQSPLKQADPTTEAGRAKYQASVDAMTDVFVAKVAEYRGVSPETVLSDFGRGSSLVGEQAVAAGMADSVGSLEGVISCLARGEMPCPPRKTTKAAPKKAESQPRRAAMSEPNESTISAAEAAELRRQLAEANEAKSRLEGEARQRSEALERDVADLKAANDLLRAKRLEDDAVAFADSVTTGKDQRAYFAERPAIIDGFRRAATYDARFAGEVVTFTAEDGKTPKQGSHLDAFKAAFNLRPVVREKRDGETVGFDLSSEPSTTEAADKEAEAKEREENIAWAKARNPRTVAAN